MDDKKNISGVIVPLLTFFEEDGSIYYEANEALALHSLKNSADVLFVFGSTGEGLYFKNKPQKKKDYLLWLRILARKYNLSTPIVVGVYGEDPKTVIKDAEQVLNMLPKSGLVVPPPVGKKLSENEQIEFYTKIASKIDAPIYIYNNPGRFGGTEITVGALEELKKRPNIRGIKDSSPTLEQKRDYLAFLDKDFTVTCGKEGMMADFIAEIPKDLRKYAGIVPSIANIVNMCSNIFALGLEGKNDEMKQLQIELNSFRNKIYDNRNPQGKAQRGVKRALSYLYSKRFNVDFSLFVTPRLQMELSPVQIKIMKDTVEEVKKKGYIDELEKLIV